jgi:flagellar secretion chaperone FliS
VTWQPSPDPRRAYRAQQIASGSPGRLVLLVYDTALRACRNGRRGLLVRALHELISCLDLEQGEIAVGLLRLYEYALWQAREGNLEEVHQVLQGLRETWARSLEIEEARAAARRTGAGAPSPASGR